MKNEVCVYSKLGSVNIKNSTKENTSVKSVKISMNAVTLKAAKRDIPKDIKILSVETHVD